ncbi:hypothetical protein DXA08_10620 [Blautia obeum]|nr:hypothetical protein DXA08_10620 [Blautia obeum]
MEYQQQIHIGPGLESICRIPQKTNADTADTEKASATQNKSKIGYTKYRESICKTKEKQDRIHQIPGKYLQNKRKASGDANLYVPRSGKHLRKSKKTNADTPNAGKASAKFPRNQMQIHRYFRKYPQPFYPTSADAFYCLKQIRIV